MDFDTKLPVCWAYYLGHSNPSAAPFLSVLCSTWTPLQCCSVLWHEVFLSSLCSVKMWEEFNLEWGQQASQPSPTLTVAYLHGQAHPCPQEGTQNCLLNTLTLSWEEGVTILYLRTVRLHTAVLEHGWTKIVIQKALLLFGLSPNSIYTTSLFSQLFWSHKNCDYKGIFTEYLS